MMHDGRSLYYQQAGSVRVLWPSQLKWLLEQGILHPVCLNPVVLYGVACGRIPPTMNVAFLGSRFEEVRSTEYGVRTPYSVLV